MRDNKPPEKPWTIHSWDDLRAALKAMQPRSKLYELIKQEMLTRGRWKRKPRGSYIAEQRDKSED